MDTLSIICITVIILSIIVSLSVIIISKRQMKKNMTQLLKMLDGAIDGSFTENTYDESMISALEVKLNQYLLSSSLSSHNLSEEKDKIKSLISDISHQTKTPIANIELYSGLLSEQSNLSDDCRYMVSEICNQSEKLNFLIGALIKTSRLETGIITSVPSLNSITSLVDIVLNQGMPMSNEKEIKIETNVIQSIASFDMKWTSEALYNVLDNALKYTQKKGKIIIKGNPYELFYRIDIIDNGIGIDENEQSKVFSRFYRSINVQEIEGVGIGLYLSREIISSQGGYIKICSKLGQGSTFSIFLPK